MKEVRLTLHDKAFNHFRFKDDFARVISGEEEGVYGWVAVNAERKTLGAPPEETLGALDMGGSSSQITFCPFFTSILEDFYALHLGNTSIRLYSHSFLGYGWADALTRVSIKIAAEALTEKPQTASARPSLGALLASPFTQQLKHKGDASTGPIRLVAQHPCFPVGHAFSFSLPRVDQAGLRLYVDLDADTLEALLLLMRIPKQERDQIVQAAMPKGVAARHRLQDEEGKETFGRAIVDSGEAADAVEGAPKIPEALATPPVVPGEASGEQPGVLRREEEEAKAEEPPRRLPGEKKRAKRGKEGTKGKHQGIKVKVKFHGSGDFEQCHALASGASDFCDRLFFNPPCFINRCSFNGVYQPRLMISKFLAFGQYAKKAMRKLCWKATWSLTLLVLGFGFSETSQQITFARPPGETPGILKRSQASPADSAAEPPAAAGWALGSMLVDVNHYPWVIPER
ncbi:uncharacterized protein LOC34623475 [Cyclospora cayetanensis]|uniref:Uncharacterized protein LOC34623475 n=1 Tax=Cyclospora cayetanensis TaxID=88456 RepID=A0A6P6RTG1_9EIME|nr:uncharacterized protein LOC34623475 [Cyclospora cayetanensis]